MIKQPWNDDRLLINDVYIGCVTKANADYIMALQKNERPKWMTTVAQWITCIQGWKDELQEEMR